MPARAESRAVPAVPDQPRALISRPGRYEHDPTAAGRAGQPLRRAVLSARPTHPKAKVEVGVQVAERWILARLHDRTFTSLEELNRASSWLRLH